MIFFRHPGPTASRVPHPAFLVLIVILFILCSGCGRKGPLQPKLQSLPAAPADVTLQQRGETFLLAWSLPERNQAGEPVAGLEKFLVQRLAFPADEACPTCRPPRREVASIDLVYPAPAQRIGSRFYWQDTDIRAGYGYRYRITPFTVGRHPGEPADVHRIYQPPPPPPSGLEAVAADRQIRLSWQRPQLPPAMQLRGYQLYRTSPGLVFPPVALNPTPLTATTLVDSGLENGQAYAYRISSLVMVDGVLLESTPSPSLLATPQQH